jgi:hypothetical protein
MEVFTSDLAEAAGISKDSGGSNSSNRHQKTIIPSLRSQWLH